MGLQANAIRALHVPGISTMAFTATFVGLVSGLATWRLTAHSAHRLTATVVGSAAGAFLGDWMLSHAHPYAPVGPAVVTAVVIAIAWVALKPRATSGPAGEQNLPVQAGSELSAAHTANTTPASDISASLDPALTRKDSAPARKTGEEQDRDRLAYPAIEGDRHEPGNGLQPQASA
jgi:hypothetical protein